jgi:hypothetical protein
MDLTAAQQQAISTLARDLGRVFGGRLESLVVYSGHDGDDTLHSLALVEGLSFRDLTACLPLAESWHRLRLAVPLMLSRDELQRTVDIFPLEYASIIATHAVVFGRAPFAGVTIPAEHLRRACEAQAKSHLIHLREAFLESHGEARLPDPAPAPTPVTLSDEALARIGETRIGIPAALVLDVLSSATSGQASIAEPSALLARYIDAAARVWEYVDRWR